MSETERLLRGALVPVEPPEALSDRLERRLALVTGAAVEELAEWELGAMRDPRNWLRPAAALVIGSTAGTALVLVRARQLQRQRRRGIRQLAPGRRDPGALRSVERGVRDAAGGVRGRLGG